MANRKLMLTVAALLLVALAFFLFPIIRGLR